MVGGAAGGDAVVDGFDGLLHEQGGEFDGVLDADAAVAEAAVVAVEELPVRRVVQVDVEAVGHVEHDEAEAGGGAGALFDLAVGPHDHVVAVEVGRVAADDGQVFGGDDVGRDDPGRVEEAGLDEGAEFRALVGGGGVADDDAGGEDGVVGAEEGQALVGDVHPDAVGGQGAG